jgi:hypothetical protein
MEQKIEVFPPIFFYLETLMVPAFSISSGEDIHKFSHGDLTIILK